MHRKFIGLLLVLFVPLVLLPTAGCGLGGLTDLVAAATDINSLTQGVGNDSGDWADDGSGETNDGGDDNGSGDGDDAGNTGNTAGTSDLSVVKTSAEIHCQARLEAGDDIIYYGFSSGNGVKYLVPSKGQTTGTAVPDADQFKSYSFAVAGQKVALVTGDFQVFIFDPDEPSALEEISLDDVRLATIPIGLHEPGHVQASGNYVAVRHESEPYVKLIDVSASTPKIIEFDVSPDYQPWHVTVDATAKQVLAVGGSVFYVYDITDPTAEPEMFDTSEEAGVAQDMMPIFVDGTVFFYDDSGYYNPYLLNLSTGKYTLLDENPAGGMNAAMAGGKFAYFLNRDEDDAWDTYSIVNRTAAGTAPGPSAQVGGAAGDPRDADLPWADFGSVAAFTPDAKYLFISGTESINIMAEFLQVSAGGASFSPFQDGDGYLAATDVSASSNCVGFKIGENEDTMVGYIVLK